MEAMLAYRFRVYPDAKNRSEIAERLVLAKDFYNLLLENAIKAYKENWSRVTMAPLNSSVQFLTYRAESAGMRMAKVDPRDTMQECSRCHNVKKEEEGLALGDRIYSCSACGLAIDREVNFAVNILSRRTAGHAGSYAREDLASLHPETDAKAGPVKREHTTESGN